METCERIASGPVVASLIMQRDCRVDLARWNAAAILEAIAISPGMHEDLTYWMSHQDLKIKLFEAQLAAAGKMYARVQGERPR
jgi:hypothetical protein